MRPVPLPPGVPSSVVCERCGHGYGSHTYGIAGPCARGCGCPSFFMAGLPAIEPPPPEEFVEIRSDGRVA